MNRLTFEGNFCDIAQCVGEPGNTSACPGGYCDQRRTWERLKQYEDLEEAGRIVRLRAGIGDVVYAIIDGKVVPMEIQYIYVNSKGRVRYHAAEAVLEKNFRDPAFGRDVFTSREAAERKVASHAR